MSEKKKITRKEALQQMGGFAIGSQLSPLLSFGEESSKSKRRRLPVKNHEQPHIIFIMTDQQRADALGSAGNENIITPNLDKLAREGARFSLCYSPKFRPSVKLKFINFKTYGYESKTKKIQAAV